MRTFIISIIVLLSGNSVVAQETPINKSKFSWNAYLETYYSYAFSQPSDHQKPGFLYNHKRHNEFSINLALVGIHFKDSMIRSNIEIMIGTYPQYNLTMEPELLKHIYQANLGMKLSKNNELWADVGIFPSHIGFESAISSDSWTLTRSILAENSPYYEAGLRVSLKSKNQKWYGAAFILNGWQRIFRNNGNNTPAFGTQFIYTPTSKLLFNSSTFIGNDQPDSVSQWRYFHNFYAVLVSSPWSLTLGLDVGFEEKHQSEGINSWFAPIIVFQYKKISGVLQEGWNIIMIRTVS